MANGTIAVSQVDVLTTSGTGTLSIVPPATNTNRTITLPDQTATLATLTTPSFGTTIGVGGATASASGSGISFPATQSASTDANTLDDYEEGTWTPVLADADTGGNTFTMSVQDGLYTKVGNVVTAYFRVTWSSKGSASGTIRLRGFPFITKANAGSYYYTGAIAPASGQTTITLSGNSTIAIFMDTSGGAGTAAEFSASDTGTGMNGSIVYLSA